MDLKLIGAVLIIVGCGGYGFLLAAAHKREENTLRQMIHLLDYMACELQYRLTPLPELLRQAATESTGLLRTIFLSFSQELDSQLSPDVSRCMYAVLQKVHDIPKVTKSCLKLMGKSLGRFDLPGQLKGLEEVRNVCRSELDKLNENRDNRLRSYQTLGLCAGAALAILFV